MARIGGEEFAVVMTDVEPLHAHALAEKLRAAVTTARPHALAHRTVTASVGLCSAPARAELRIEDLMARADRLLYRAKADGRDRVVQESA